MSKNLENKNHSLLLSVNRIISGLHLIFNFLFFIQITCITIFWAFSSESYHHSTKFLPLFVSINVLGIYGIIGLLNQEKIRKHKRNLIFSALFSIVCLIIFMFLTTFSIVFLLTGFWILLSAVFIYKDKLEGILIINLPLLIGLAVLLISLWIFFTFQEQIALIPALDFILEVFVKFLEGNK